MSEGGAWTLPLVGGAAASLLMLGLWRVERRRLDAGVVDAGWAAAIGGLAVFYAASLDGDPSRRLLLGCLGALWAGRLTLLLRGRLGSGAEDGRYGMLRRQWGARAGRNFFFFFQFQAGLALVFSLPFWAGSQDPAAPGALDALGGALWLLGVGGESLADRQLDRFRADPANRGRTCRLGLWRYSRHPNYFFEWLHWCAYVPLTLGGPYPWAAPAAAALMLYLVLNLTGIPYAEKRALASRGEEYRRYRRSTSAFIPWFPRKDMA